MLKELEKIKVQKIIDKIQQQEFDDNDIDNLFMKLRAYSNGFKLFREIADFVAHNDERHKGITVESLQAMFYSMRYFVEYTSSQKTLDITKPFPIWIKKLIKYQIEKIDKNKLQTEYHVLPNRLKTRIDKGFQDNKTLKTTELINGKLSLETLKAIQYVMSFIISKPVYQQEEIIDELINVLKKNNINFTEDIIKKNADKITLCVLLLLHNTEFKHDGHKKGRCSISAENLSIFHDTKFIDLNGSIIEPPQQSFGTLQVNGHVTIQNKGKDVTIVFPIMSTKLNAKDYCDVNLFSIDQMNEKPPIVSYKKLNLDGNLFLTPKSQLARIKDEIATE